MAAELLTVVITTSTGQAVERLARRRPLRVAHGLDHGLALLEQRRRAIADRATVTTATEVQRLVGMLGELDEGSGIDELLAAASDESLRLAAGVALRTRAEAELARTRLGPAPASSDAAVDRYEAALEEAWASAGHHARRVHFLRSVTAAAAGTTLMVVGSDTAPLLVPLIPSLGIVALAARAAIPTWRRTVESRTEMRSILTTYGVRDESALAQVVDDYRAWQAERDLVRAADADAAAATATWHDVSGSDRGPDHVEDVIAARRDPRRAAVVERLRALLGGRPVDQIYAEAEAARAALDDARRTLIDQALVIVVTRDTDEQLLPQAVAAVGSYRSDGPVAVVTDHDDAGWEARVVRWEPRDDEATS